MSLHFWARCVVLAAAACELLVDAALPRTLSSESEALTWLRQKDAVAQCDPDAASWLIGKGWWNAARELVTASHSQADGKCRANLETVVRRHVGDMKIQADGVLLALSPPDTKVGMVRCSFQWAQNSTAVFLFVKFSHRWSSPGALKVHDEKAAVSDCCFNFSAAGEHSQLRKRYTLDLNFFREVDTRHWSWQPAAAGRLTVEIRKKDPAKWPRLLASKEKTHNMATWESMHSKWSSELEGFDKNVAAEKRKHNAKSGEGKHKDDEEAADEVQHEDGPTACYDSRQSPFHRDKHATQLCDAYWPPALKGKRGTETRWIVVFYSLSALNCRERSKECTAMHDFWSAVSTRVSDSAVAKVGIVDCDANKAFCTKHKVGHMPFVRRYKDGKKKAYYGELDIDLVMRFILA